MFKVIAQEVFPLFNFHMGSFITIELYKDIIRFEFYHYFYLIVFFPEFHQYVIDMFNDINCQ